MYPAIGDAPLLLGASQFSDTAFVETPVTLRFRTFDGVVGFGAGAAAICTFFEACTTTGFPRSSCSVAWVVIVCDPAFAGVQFMVPVQVATGVTDPSLTGVHVPAMVPRLVPSLTVKPKLTAPSPSQVGPASFAT